VKNQQAEIAWQAEGVPVSRRFDDPYYSLQDGLAETRHVFLAGNDLATRLASELHIAELGFGTGLNFLATLALRAEAGHSAPLTFTSFEAFPMAADDMARALAPFEALRPISAPLLAGMARGETVLEILPDVTLRLELGDATERLPAWEGRADAWFLDGFSPAKNPELWGPELMAEVAAHTQVSGSFATYTAAGFVRRGLAAAGFEVMRVPGFGRKRHMTRGWLR